MKIRNSGAAEGPNESNTYTAGIDVFLPEAASWQHPWWIHAIEFHSKSKAEAERIRDLVMARLEN